MAPHLGYVIVYVGDLGASIAFYRDVIGLALKFEDAGYAEFATSPPGSRSMSGVAPTG